MRGLNLGPDLNNMAGKEDAECFRDGSGSPRILSILTDPHPEPTDPDPEFFFKRLLFYCMADRKTRF